MQPSFDNWTTGFLFFSILGVLTAILLLIQNKKRREPIFYLSILLLFFSLLLFDYVLFWTHYQVFYPFLFPLSISFYFLFGPLIFLYIKSLYGIKMTFYQRAIHFLIFILILAILSPIIVSSGSSKKEILLAQNVSYLTMFSMISWFSVLHLAFYAYLSYQFLAVFRPYTRAFRWVRNIVFFFVGFIFSLLSYYILSAYGMIDKESDYIISVFMSIFIVSITYVGFVLPELLNDMPASLPTLNYPKKKYLNSPLDENKSKALAQKLDSKVFEQKLWRKADVGLEDLAQILELPKQYISQILNESLNVNFYEYINDKRLNEAMTLLSSEKEKNKNIIEIAYESGFNNKVSFNKAFKIKTGMTPNEFRKNSLSIESSMNK